MIGTKIDKPIEDFAAYTELAKWCQSNGAIIVDKGDYYECIFANQPTKDETLASLDAKYASDKDALIKQYADAVIHDDRDLIEELKNEMTALDDQYDAEYAKLEGENHA